MTQASETTDRHTLGKVRPHPVSYTHLDVYKRQEQDRLILQTQSPDGKLVAEVHTFTTGMWGWPDTLYVALRESENPFGDKVYARTYE